MQICVKEYYDKFSSHITKNFKNWGYAINSSIDNAVRFAGNHNKIKYLILQGSGSNEVKLGKEE